ncbi:RING finger protein 17 isoform X2 [Wyeomyia smithii]|nr:RING finger protein 17 isoform X2 [Wyeomyia smithii]
MKKMLHTAPITAQIQEPSRNPFNFREKEPLRKEIRNYFGLTCTSDSYRYKYLPFYTPEPFPVLEPMNSLEPKKPYEAASSASGNTKSDRVNKKGYKSKTPSEGIGSESTKNRSNSASRRSEEIQTARDQLSMGSSESELRRIKKSHSKRKHKKSSRHEKHTSDSSAHQSSTTTDKQRAPSPDVVFVSTIPNQSDPQCSQHATDSHKEQQPLGVVQSNRTLGGRLVSYGSTNSTQSNSNKSLPAIMPADAAHEMVRKPILEINPINPDNATFIKYSQKVQVTCVINPNKFYVITNQKQFSIINELCEIDSEKVEEPEKINIGSIYLAQPISERRWYRAKILSRAKHGKKYEVLFVDFGRTDEIPRTHFREMTQILHDTELLACECTLYDLVPADGGSTWSPEARQLMIDVIENKHMIMYVIQNTTSSEPLLVDLISQTVDNPKSLRSTLIYLNVAKTDPKPPKRTSDAQLRIHQLENSLQKWNSEYKRKINARELEKDDVFKAKLTCSISPSEFYIRNNAWQEQFDKMQQQLAEYCSKEAKIAYLPHVGMVCAFAEQDPDDVVVWKRGRIIKLGEAHCEVASVDTGHRLLIEWQDIRYMPKQFCLQPEFAVCCKLMHVMPFKQHNYRWTQEAIADFNRLAKSNSVFQIIVDSRDSERFYDVALYVVKKRHDICVNGLMVKNGFAVSTGAESIIVERPKETPVVEDKTAMDGGDTASERTVATKSSASEKRKARVRVELLRVVSPGEFYVSLVKNANGISRMQEEIQNRMDEKMDEGDDKTEWKVDELCLVFPTMTAVPTPDNDGIGCEWYRARVIEVVDDSNYTVFLIDRAFTMNAHYSNMCTIPADLKQIHPAAIRCFLACIGPTGNQPTWSSSVIDAFKVAIEKFHCFSISLHGKSVDDSLPVILWGMTSENTTALSPLLFQYTNINNNLVQYGYVHLKEKFMALSSATSVEEELLRHYQAFDKFVQSLDTEMVEPDIEPSFSGSCDTYQDDITNEPTPIDRWPPAKPIDKSIFVGVPTYVDNNGVIYLHDVEKEQTLSALKKLINAKFDGSKQLPSDKFYASGEPCVAKFHIDDQFYRAIVRKAISPCRYKVQFVDYGNIEECDVEDLRKNVICGRVPILVNKYRLTDVAPVDPDVVWKTEVLDTLHSLIVGKQCQVRVDTDMDCDAAGVIPCYLKVTGAVSVDVSEYLLEQKMVIKKHGIFEEKVDQLFDPYMNLFGSKRGNSPKGIRFRIGANFGTEAVSDSESDAETPTNFRGRFSKKEMNDLLDHVTAEQSRSAAADFDEELDEESEEIGIDLNKVQYFFSFGDVKLETGSDLEDGEVADDDKLNDEAGGGAATDVSSNVSFNPIEFDTSTQIDPPVELTRPTLHGYPKFELDKSIKGFYCEVTNLISPFNLFVYPQLDDHIQQMKEMMAKIQCYVRKQRKCSDIEENMPCLAIYKQDSFWYRGLIEEYFPDQGEVRVFYVDYLNKETISVRDILKCPVSLRRVPLRNVQVQLHALRANPRMRESDIMMKLIEIIEGKRIYAKVTSHSPTLEVELYTDSKCTNLVYHKMIKEKYFVVAETTRRRDN